MPHQSVLMRRNRPPRVTARVTGVLLGGSLLATVFAATPLDEALRLLQQGEGLRALAQLKPLAEGGNAEAQFRLGTIYERGIGVVPDDYWAWYWYQLAAAQGHTPAVEALQALGERTGGAETPVEAVAEAASPLEDAAGAVSADGDPRALVGPGDASSTLPAQAVATGEGPGPVDGGVPPEAVLPGTPPAADAAWAQAAVPPAAIPDATPAATSAAGAEAPVAAPAGVAGEVRAPGPGELAALAKARERGLIVSFDDAQPLPAPRGDDTTEQPTEDAFGGARPMAVVAEVAPSANVAVVTEHRPAAAAVASTSPARDLVKLADPEISQLAAGGDIAAQRELALRLHAGRGRPRDIRSAITWYRRAAEAGDAEAQYQLGNLYLMGDGIEADDVWAITWFRRAAGQGHAKARAHLENLVKLSGGRP